MVAQLPVPKVTSQARRRSRRRRPARRAPRESICTLKTWRLGTTKIGRLTINGGWPFQVPKLEVPTIYKGYIRPM